MKIAVFHPFFDVFGGAEKIILTLCSNISRNYGFCDLYTPHFPKEGYQFLKYSSRENIRIITSNSKLRKSRLSGVKFNPLFLIDILNLAKKAKMKKYDAVISCNWPSIIVPYIAKKYFGLETEILLYLCLEPDHGLHYKRLFGKFPYSENAGLIERMKLVFALPYLTLMRGLDYKIINQQNCLITLSNNIRNKVKKVFGTRIYNKTYPVLHDYVNPSLFYPNKKYNKILRKKYNIPFNHSIIFSLGRLTGYPKKTYLVIEAAKHLLKKTNKFTVLIGGTGPEKQNLVELVKRYKLDDKIIFLGFVEENDLPKYYNLCDIFIFTAYDEPSGPLTMLEAMACEKPVVISKSGGPLEIIENKKDGLFAEPNSAQDYADKMMFLVSNKNIAEKIAKAGRKNVLANFTEELFFRHFDAFLKQILNK